MARKSYDGKGFLTYYQQLAVDNPCYQKNGDRSKTTHLILHSTGANNPNLKRYVTPDDGMLGQNRYKNGWNSPDEDTLVHAVIGKNKDGVIEAYQIAPWMKLVWGCGSGSKGSGNSFAIQVEMCEDRTLGASYAKDVYNVAVKFFAFLCKAHGISTDNIWSHCEARAKGYASPHGDPEKWWDAVNSGLTMNGFRKAVKSLLNEEKSDNQTTLPNTEKPATNATGVLYRVQVGAFSIKKNATAKKAAVEAAGYDCFVVQVGSLWKVQVGAYSGKHNADSMVARLKKDGFTAVVVSGVGSAAAKTVTEVARECISGKWGNGEDRKARLKAAGYDPVAVQKEINRLLR